VTFSALLPDLAALLGLVASRPQSQLVEMKEGEIRDLDFTLK
jgi:hypothetical protein